MRIIVDANIVFSAILNTDSKIADLLFNSGNIFDFIAPDFLRKELKKYHKKISLISGLTLNQVEEIENHITRSFVFISEDQIPLRIRVLAEELVKDIDPKDVIYIAFAKYFKCKLWTGDKKLKSGLQEKRFKAVISTSELYILREKKTKKNN